MQLMFDLDGTLTDSREGVTRCIQHALAEAGMVVLPLEELTRYVGPPLPRSFAKLLATTNTLEIEAAMSSYRRRFEQIGMFENHLYPGIVELLTALAGEGHGMNVVTAKPRVYAVQILGHFGISHLFGDVYGPELGTRIYTKESLIRDACARIPASGGCGIMIGDRAEDVLGAKINGLGSVGVTWGYGPLEELEATEPDCIVGSPSELADYIRGLPRC